MRSMPDSASGQRKIASYLHAAPALTAGGNEEGGFQNVQRKVGGASQGSPADRGRSSVFTDLDKIVASCKEDLYGMRLRHIATPPDGFIVCDVDGRELRRWFGPLPIEPSRTERFKSQEVGT
jgi:hypothetical protein